MWTLRARMPLEHPPPVNWQVGSCRIANIIIKLVTRIHELWSRHCGCIRSADQSIEVDSYYSKFHSESMHQRGAVIRLRLMIQKAVRFQ